MSLDLSKLSNVQRFGDKTTAACPVCREAGSDRAGNHLVIFPSGKYGCVTHQNDAEHSRAIFALVGIGGSGVTAAEPPAEQVTIDKTWPVTVLDKLIRDHSYWQKRGISPATVEPFRGGVATEFQLKARYVFPIFNERDEIIGFTGRSLGNMTPKWKHLGKTSKWIWGGLDEIGDRVILCESIGDSLALRENGVPESLCLFGLNMSEAVLGWLIARNPHEIIISTNRDVSGVGQQAAQKIEKTLSKFFDPGVVRIVQPPEGIKDWGEAKDDVIKAIFLDGEHVDNRTDFEIGLDSTEISEIIHDQ